MKIFKLFPALFAAAALSFTACGIDDDDDDVIGGGVTPVVNPENLTPEEIKERVADIALDVMDKFQVKDHEELANFASYLVSEYGDVRYEDAEEPTFAGLSRGYQIIDFTEDIPTGIYTPVNGYWTLTGESENTILRIPQDRRYGRIELTVKRSGKMDAEITIPYEDGYYDEYGNYHEVNGEENFYVVAPTTVEATLTANGKTYISHKLDAVLDSKKKTLTATETLTAANISTYATVNATNTQAVASANATIGGAPLASSNATLTGRNLCDMDAILEAAEDETFDRMFTSVTGSGNIMNRLYTTFTVKALGEVANAIDYWAEFGPEDWGWCDFSSEQAAAEACDKQIALINRNLSSTLSFTPGGKSIASVTYIKDGYKGTSYEGYPYGEFYPVPALKFNDGTTYTEEYFDYGFELVINKWATLVRAYKNLCD